jgi:hypothetical protein
MCSKAYWKHSLILISLAMSILMGCTRPSRVPRHDITINTIDGEQKFYNQRTRSAFVPRGNNYIGLTDRSTGGDPDFRHSTFDTDVYDSAEAERQLSLMHRMGYNTVRVFLNTDRVPGLGDSDGEGLSVPYVANVANFLEIAARYDIYVIITHDWLPDTEPYASLVNRDGGTSFAGFNRIYLTAGGVEASQKFWQDFIEILRLAGPLDHVLAYQIQNEFFYDTHEAPFTDASAAVSVANGNTYDLSDTAQMQEMMDSGMVYFLNQVTAAIKAKDPNALVTNGYFLPFHAEYRRFSVVPAFEESNLDFVDLHIYPHEFYHDVETYASVFGIDTPREKPIVIGEMGAFRGGFGRTPLDAPVNGSRVFAYLNNADASYELANWQAALCDYGVDGWLTWTWDTNVQSSLYSALGDASQGDLGVDLETGPVRVGDGRTVPITDPEHGIVGFIAYYLSPLARPDPCRGVVVVQRP